MSMSPEPARVPRLALGEARAAADEAGVPDYMAELAIFQVLLNHPRLAASLNDLLAIMLWHGKLDVRLRELDVALADNLECADLHRPPVDEESDAGTGRCSER